MNYVTLVGTVLRTGLGLGLGVGQISSIQHLLGSQNSAQPWYLFLNDPALTSALHGDSVCACVRYSMCGFMKMYLEVMLCYWPSTYIFHQSAFLNSKSLIVLCAESLESDKYSIKNKFILPKM